MKLILKIITLFKFLDLDTFQFDKNYSNKSIVFPHDLLNKSKK